MSEDQKETIRVPAEDLPVIEKADVIVVGGGTSGFIAATASARTGADTILVERYGYLGGCSTAPYNTSVNKFGDTDGNQVIRGLPWEFLKRMEADGQAFVRETGNQLWPPYTKKIALDMITDAGVNLYFYTWAVDVIMDGQVVRGIVVQSKAGRAIMLARTFVDASADADISAWGGAPFLMEEADDLQQVSCDYIACGVDPKKVIKWAEENEKKLELRISGKEVEHKEIGSQPMFTIVIPNADTYTDATGKTHHVGVMPTVKLCLYREAVRIQGNVNINPLDPKALTYAEVEGIKGALNHLNYMKENVDGFEGAFVVSQSHLGIRESRRIGCDYYITIDDVNGQVRFDDVVSLNCRGLDYHLKGTVFKYSLPPGNHDVPLRALTPQNIDNVVVAGRCISCDHLAQASLRGAGTCMAIGHAAGVTASLASQHTGKIRDLNVRKIQRTLLEQNAILSTHGRVFDDQEFSGYAAG